MTNATAAHTINVVKNVLARNNTFIGCLVADLLANEVGKSPHTHSMAGPERAIDKSPAAIADRHPE